MEDPEYGDTRTLSQRFQSCTDTTDEIWRHGRDGCTNDVERAQWRVCFDAYLRGRPTPGLSNGRVVR